MSAMKANTNLNRADAVDYVATGWRGAALGELLAAIRRCRTETYTLWDHSLAVGATAFRLAASLGLSPSTRRLVYLGGLLHDVGKTRTRLETLFKPGPLDGHERAHMRLHPTIGAGLVRSLDVDAVVEAAHCHHELFDGSGYPDGLAGAQIPYTARIVAVADHYEALRESRPYRPIGCTRNEALSLVARLATSRKLDPAVSRHLPHVTGVATPSPSNYLHTIARHFELSL